MQGRKLTPSPCDGKTCVPLVPSQDHKAVGDGDQGPNTEVWELTVPCRWWMKPARRLQFHLAACPGGAA